MALKVNCDGFQRDNYFARSWALFTQDSGWIKPLLLLTLAQLIPIIGPLGASGYIVEWARLIAWNTNAAPKQHSVNIGECILSGWRSFLVTLVWTIVLSLVIILLTMVPIIGVLFSLLSCLISLFVGQLINVAILRASIYQKLGAGFKVSRIWEMAERDVEGLFRILGIDLIGNLIIVLIISIVGSVMMFALLPTFTSIINSYETLAYSATEQDVLVVMNTMIDVFVSYLPFLSIVSLITHFVGNLVHFVVMGAVGLWMRQFNVPAWGRSEDPLPAPLPETVVYYQPAPTNPMQTPGYGYGYQAQPPVDNQGYAYPTAQQQVMPEQQFVPQEYNADVPVVEQTPVAEQVTETVAEPVVEAVVEVMPEVETAPEVEPIFEEMVETVVETIETAEAAPEAPVEELPAE